MERNEASLKVCLYLSNPWHFHVPLAQIAGGHVFGPYQHLELVLQSPEHGALLLDVASDVQDCCFPLVQDVTTIAAPGYDVIMVFLPSEDSTFDLRNDLDLTSERTGTDSKTSLAHLAIHIGHLLDGTLCDSTKVLVVGPNSNLMASLLTQRLGLGLGDTRIVAFQPQPQLDGTKTRGQYKMATTLCQTISDWWAGIKRFPSSFKAGIKYFGKATTQANVPAGVFCSTPVEVQGMATYRVCPGASVDFDVMSSTLQRTSQALKEMREISNEPHKDKTNASTFMSFL